MTDWTTPKTWAAGEVLIASDYNTYIRDNQAFLKNPPVELAVASSSQSTSSTSYVDITALSVNHTSQGGDLLICVALRTYHSTAGGSAAFQVIYDGPTQALETLAVTYGAASAYTVVSFCGIVTGLSAAARTFKVQMRVTGGTSVTVYNGWSHVREL